MLKEYEEFLKDFDSIISQLFENQKKYVKCHKGCSLCCEIGEYPFSQLEFAYLTQGYLQLPENRKILVQQNIRNLLMDKKEYKGEKRFEHKCPFLINRECSVYQYRGLVCRTFGVCYYDDVKGVTMLPECVHYGLNYSENYDDENKELHVDYIPRVNLRIDRILNSQVAHKYNLESGEIRPIVEWFGTKK